MPNSVTSTAIAAIHLLGVVFIMKNTEILDRLKNGEVIKVESIMKFKRNKIVRGSFTKYSINSNTIKSTQFDSLRDNLEKIEELCSHSCKVYKLRVS